jgi:hypothetical protein
VIVLSEGHLKGLLTGFIEEYYPIARSYQGLNGVPPVPAAKSLPLTVWVTWLRFRLSVDCITATFSCDLIPSRRLNLEKTGQSTST